MTEAPEPMVARPSGQLFLDWWRVIRITGADRRGFLQGQLTQDVASLTEDGAVFAGWADARGRLLAITRTWCTTDAILLALPADLADRLLTRLRLFTLRAKVEISLTAEAVAAAWDPGAVAAGGLWGGGPAKVLSIQGDTASWLVVGERDGVAARLRATGLPSASQDDWHLRQIRLGLPELTPATVGEFIPQMVNLELLGGVSFTKGCYVGQEIVARTRYLGRVKRRMLRFTASCPPPAPGTLVRAARGSTGQVVLATGNGSACELLAVVGLEDLPGPLWLGNEPCKLHCRPLPYPIPELAQADPSPSGGQPLSG